MYYRRSSPVRQVRLAPEQSLSSGDSKSDCQPSSNLSRDQDPNPVQTQSSDVIFYWVASASMVSNSSGHTSAFDTCDRVEREV